MHLLAMVPQVTPLAGVWVEIPPGDTALDCSVNVTPLAGVWVEIVSAIEKHDCTGVTPLAGRCV